MSECDNWFCQVKEFSKIALELTTAKQGSIRSN